MFEIKGKKYSTTQILNLNSKKKSTEWWLNANSVLKEDVIQLQRDYRKITGHKMHFNVALRILS